MRGKSKTCAQCGQSFMAHRADAEHCSKRCAKKTNYQRNKDQHYEQHRRWVQDHPERVREMKRKSATVNRVSKRSTQMKRIHGSNWESAFAAFWEAQGGCCYLCGDPLDREGFRRVHLDHDHSCCSSGSSCPACRRGLACPQCNVLVGLAADDPDRLRRIAANLEAANVAVRSRMATAPVQDALL